MTLICVSCDTESLGWAVMRPALLPRLHDPVSLLNWNAEQPRVKMQSDVQWTEDLKDVHRNKALILRNIMDHGCQ